LEFYENIQSALGFFYRIAACNKVEVEAMRYRLVSVVSRKEVMENSKFLKHAYDRFYSPFKSNGVVGHQQA
jgi:hypothetical protein